MGFYVLYGAILMPSFYYFELVFWQAFAVAGVLLRGFGFLWFQFLSYEEILSMLLRFGKYSFTYFLRLVSIR